MTFPIPAPERGVPAGAVVLLGVLLAVGAYAGWYRLSGEGRLPAETSTQVPLRLAPLAEQALPTEQPRRPSSPRRRRLSRHRCSRPRRRRFRRFRRARRRPPRSRAVPPVPGASPDQPRIVLRASADAWVQVRDRAGPVLLNRILHPGETWEVPAEAEPVADHRATPAAPTCWWTAWPAASLGGSGAVRRDLPLDPDLIKDGKLATASPRPNPQ